MAGFLLHQGATVRCTDGGEATPLVTNSRVRVSGQDTILIPTPYAISQCPVGNSPCATGMFIVPALRVRSLGIPVVLSTSNSTSAPRSVPMQVLSTQQRVKGQ